MAKLGSKVLFAFAERFQMSKRDVTAPLRSNQARDTDF